VHAFTHSKSSERLDLPMTVCRWAKLAIPAVLRIAAYNPNLSPHLRFPCAPIWTFFKSKELAEAIFTYAPPHTASRDEVVGVIDGFAHAAGSSIQLDETVSFSYRLLRVFYFLNSCLLSPISETTATVDRSRTILGSSLRSQPRFVNAYFPTSSLLTKLT
jgi:hypothetical protein